GSISSQALQRPVGRAADRPNGGFPRARRSTTPAPAILRARIRGVRKKTDALVSKQDTHFFNVFSLVIGLLVAVAVGLFALARIRPPVKEAIAGRDNSALAIKPAEGTAEGGASGTAVAAAMPQNGTQLFEQTCNVCHGQGIGGAPKAGDKAAWAARIAEGKAMLYEHALKGFQGKAGVMPPKGGRMDAPDDLVKQAVDHMVQLAQ